MRLERWIALALLMFMIAYAWAAYHYPLLPFERNQAFKPNSLPLGLSAVGIVLALAMLLIPSRKDEVVIDESVVDSESGEEKQHNKRYDKVRPIILVLLMVCYALALRPLGFILSTSLFLILASVILGERKFHVLVPIAAIAAFLIWYLVQQVLGIYLTPWPAILN